MERKMIYLDDAIDAVYKCADIFAGDMPVMVVKADAYEALAQLPSAQPETIIESDEGIKLQNSNDKAAKRLNDLIFDINPAEICSQIESDNLKNWCNIIQTEMKMAMVQLPCWGREDTDE